MLFSFSLWEKVGMREKFHPLPPEGERFDSTEEESHLASL
jgi:hypothetical protein